jgi:hypothetical protein
MAKFSREQQLERVHQLINACGKGASEQEVENNMRIVRKLMDDYGVTMADVDALRQDSKGEAEKTYKRKQSVVMGESGKKQHLAQFEGRIANAVGEFTDTCPLVFRGKRLVVRKDGTRDYEGKVTLTFVGDEMDVAIACATFNMIMRSCKDLARKACGEGWKPAHRSFAEGYASGLWTKVTEAKRQAAAQFDGTANAETFVLVRASKGDWLKGVLQEMGIREAKPKKQRGAVTADYWAGRAEGLKADLEIRDKLDN